MILRLCFEDAFEHDAQQDHVLPAVWTAYVKLCEETTKRKFRVEPSPNDIATSTRRRL